MQLVLVPGLVGEGGGQRRCETELADGPADGVGRQVEQADRLVVGEPEAPVEVGDEQPLGDGCCTAATTVGVAAMVSATAVARAMASMSPARWACTNAPARPAATTSTATPTCSTKVWVATLQRAGDRVLTARAPAPARTQ